MLPRSLILLGATAGALLFTSANAQSLSKPMPNATSSRIDSVYLLQVNSHDDNLRAARHRDEELRDEHVRDEHVRDAQVRDAQVRENGQLNEQSQNEERLRNARDRDQRLGY